MTYVKFRGQLEGVGSLYHVGYIELGHQAWGQALLYTAVLPAPEFYIIDFLVKVNLGTGHGCCTPLIPTIRRQRWANLYEFKVA